MCDYQGYEFGAGHYPDSVCIEGRIFDADACYDNEEDIPCPMCRPTDAVGYWADQNSFFDDFDPTEALAIAMSLVTDIRANRGVIGPIEPPKSED